MFIKLGALIIDNATCLRIANVTGCNLQTVKLVAQYFPLNHNTLSDQLLLLISKKFYLIFMTWKIKK